MFMPNWCSLVIQDTYSPSFLVTSKICENVISYNLQSQHVFSAQSFKATDHNTAGYIKTKKLGPFTKFLLKQIIIYELFAQVMRGILILTITKPLKRIFGKSKRKLMAFKRLFRIMTLALFAFAIRSEYFVNVNENQDIS